MTKYPEAAGSVPTLEYAALMGQEDFSGRTTKSKQRPISIKNQKDQMVETVSRRDKMFPAMDETAREMFILRGGTVDLNLYTVGMKYPEANEENISDFKDEQDHIHNIQKYIWINNFEKVEKYLDLDPQEDNGLHSLKLSENADIKGVRELLSLIPLLPDQASLQEFYENTGLNIRIEWYEGCKLTMEDRNGHYPRRSLNVWNPDFEQLAQEADLHPEWFEPQEEADLIIRYVEVSRQIEP